MQENEREKQMSPAERRRRMEARKRRQKERQRRKRRRLMMIIGGIVLAVLVIGLIVFGITRLTSGGNSEIKAKGDTFVIALDPGHGGEDIGMSNGDTVEKNVTLDICSKLKIMLERQGYQAVMLREDDTRVAKEDRIQAANDSKADLLISIHCGYSDDASESGAVSHYKKESKASENLAEMIQESLAEISGIQNGGASEGDYEIVANTDMPAVLIEVGYLSNAEEAASLGDDQYQSTAARGIATAIVKKLRQNN